VNRVPEHDLCSGIRMGDHAAPRLAGFDYVGLYRYSLTICTYRRVPWFTEGSIVVPARTQLLHIMQKYRFDVIAYCFMPDHAHVLLEAQAASCALKPPVQRWKQVTGFAHRREHEPRLWQTGYYDHVLRDDADVLAAAAYIVANPIRGGLAQSILNYPHVGSTRYSMVELAEAIQVRRCTRNG
jgi:putative transposase